MRLIGFLVLIGMVVLVMFYGYPLVTDLLDGQKMELVVYNKAPQQHNLAYVMKLKLPAAKYYKKYRYMAQGQCPSGFDYNTYLLANPKDAVYVSKPSGTDTSSWLVIFSDEPPLDANLKYKKYK